MTVAGRMATGTALLLLLLLAGLAYHLSVVRKLAATQRDLSTHQVRAIVHSLELMRRLERIEESARKLAVTADPDYGVQLGEESAAFAERLGRLEPLLSSAPERQALAALAAGWAAFERSLAAAEPWEGQAEPAARQQRMEASLEALRSLRPRVGELIDAADLTLDRQVERSGRARHEAERVALGVFGVALALALVAVLATVRSINRPMRRLIEATEKVGEEDFLCQLPAPGRGEFGRLARAFNSMVEKLAELDQMKKNLLSHVSHELRTPLANVQESHLLLLEEIPGPLTADQRRLLELNVGSCRRLSRLISNLLDLSRFEAGAVAYDFGERDLREVITDVVAEFSAQAQEAGLLLATDLPREPLQVRCDRERLAQVLQNLVDNALKFSPPGGRVEVRARALPGGPSDLPLRFRHLRGQHGPLVQLEVTDEGPGVPEAEREKIFGRFYRAAARPRGARGVGLGLAICREIVDAHRGAIWAAASGLVGSRFCVVLPVARAAVPAAAVAARRRVAVA